MTTRLHQSLAPPAREAATTTSPLPEILPLVALALAALVTLYVRVRLISVPLERDEGEYAYIGHLILQGRTPFLDAYTMKLPGTPMAYAFFMSIFGKTTEGIHLGLLAVNALTAGLLWLVARRLFDYRTAAASAAIFLLLTMSKGVLGVFAHATQFVNLFAVAGFLLILHYRENARQHTAFVAGICFGVAILMKQHAVVLAFFAGCLVAWIAYRQTKHWIATISMSALFFTGAAIPLALIVLWTILAGTFDKMSFWTFEYALEYAKGLSFPVGLSLLKIQFARIASLELPLWILAAIGLAILLSAGHREQAASRILVIGLLISSFVALCPGFYFREHYFVLILPSVAMLSGLAISRGVALVSARRSAAAWGSAIWVVTLLGTLGYGYWTERAYLFQRTPTEVSTDLYWPNPFRESMAIADYIKVNSTANDKIAVLGSEPQLFFYANRRTATGYIYMYGLVEDQPYAETMQREAVAEIEASSPLYLVFVNVPNSWFNDKSPAGIFHWFREYAGGNYRLTGIVDIDRPDSRYVWGEDATTYTPQSPNFVTVWRRVEHS